METHSFSYLDFYVRRIKRIFPALIFVFIFTIITGWFILLPGEFESLGKNIIAGTAFVSNIISWKEIGYFNTTAEFKPLLHLWSLGVEEQYYIIWPILVALTWKRSHGFFLIIVTIFIGSFLINAYTINMMPSATFYLPITRFWELMMGSLLALITLHEAKHFNNKILSNIFSFLGLCLLIAGLFLIDAEKNFPGYWALLPTGGAFFIILAGKKSWINSKILSNKIMILIGLISYPLYLWHWPLLAYSKIVGLISFYDRIAILCVSFILAYFTYVAIEKPLRVGLRNILAKLVFSMLSVAALGLLIFSGFIQSLHSTDEIKKISRASGEWSYPGDMISFKFNNRTFHRINNDKLMEPYPDEVVFFGDSNMQMYYPNIDNLSYTSKKSIIFATQGGCPPIPNVRENMHKECNDFVDDVIAYASKSTVKTIVIGAQWYGYFEKESKYYIHNKDSHNFFLSESLGKNHAIESLEKLLTKLHEMDKTTYLLLNIPIGDTLNPKNMINRSLASEVPFFSVNYGSVSINSLVKYQDIDTALIEVAHKSKAKIIDPKIFLWKNGKYPSITETGEPIYKDGSHLRPSFVRTQIHFLDETIN